MISLHVAYSDDTVEATVPWYLILIFAVNFSYISQLGGLVMFVFFFSFYLLHL